MRAMKTSQGRQKEGYKVRFSSFKAHFDTGQLRHNLRAIPEGALTLISEKIHGCVHEDTLVDTLELGTTTIKELFSNNAVGKHVRALDTSKSEQVWTEIEDTYFYPNDIDWYEIELKNGKKITITGNNPVWMPDLQAYRNVEELEQGDIVLSD